MSNQISDFKKLEKTLDYNFNHKELLINALTHSSYLNEHEIEMDRYTDTDNETLEFLGDAVLELAISKYLYDTFHEKLNEGSLSLIRSNLVSETSLASLSKKISLSNYLRMSKGEYQSNGHKRASTLSDTLEAIFGAMYLDSSFVVAELKIIQLYKKYDKLDVNLYGDKDFKSRLQEYIQGMGNKVIIEYKLQKETGPEHNKTFYSDVFISSKLFGTGKGSTKKNSEQMAAKEALNKLVSDKLCF